MRGTWRLFHAGTRIRQAGGHPPTLSPPSPTDSPRLYRYNAGRWLWNEQDQRSGRYVRFNLAELVRAAVQATGARSCTQVQKLPEGNFSKVLLMTMDNGTAVIAKLPNPNAGRPHFTTASEVATMQYVREVLHIPGPRVHAWSSSSDTPVGAEYIIMERSRGVELSKVWHGMPGREKFQILQQLVTFEKSLVASRFPMYGSLYYAKDLPTVQPHQLVDVHGEKSTVGSVFAVGPTTNRTFFDHGRDAVDGYRGPWSSVEDYLLARAHRELACLKSSSSFPRPQGLFYGPGQYQPTTEAKQRALQDYIQVAPLLTPKDRLLAKPALWHPDLHGDNIFVHPDRPTEILSVIDWQAFNLAPLFLQVHHPALVEFEGPVPDGLQSIALPDNFADLSPEKQLEAKKLRAAQSLYKLYDILLLQQCPEIAQALSFKNSFVGHLVGLAGSIFTDGEPVLQGMLIRLAEEWATVIGESIPCPLSVSAEDKRRQREEETQWASGVQLMEDTLDQLGAYRVWDGWVNHDDYEPLRQRLERCRELFLDRHARSGEERDQWRAVWPFTDKQ